MRTATAGGPRDYTSTPEGRRVATGPTLAAGRDAVKDSSSATDKRPIATARLDGIGGRGGIGRGNPSRGRT